MQLGKGFGEQVTRFLVLWEKKFDTRECFLVMMESMRQTSQEGLLQ